MTTGMFLDTTRLKKSSAVVADGSMVSIAVANPDRHKSNRIKLRTIIALVWSGSGFLVFDPESEKKMAKFLSGSGSS